MTVKTIHAPRIHMNGTGKAQLVGAYETALDALEAVFRTIRDTAPNGRDYYTDGPAAMEAAQAQHRGWMLTIDNLRNEIDGIIGAIDRNEITGTATVTA